MVLLGATPPLPTSGPFFVDDDNCPRPGTDTLGDPFCKIQDAVDAANGAGGDLIKVRRSVYTEQVSITKGVTVRGVGWNAKHRVIVEAQAGGPVVGGPNFSPPNTFTVAASPGDKVTIERMAIRNGRYGIRSTAGDTSVRWVKFIHNGYDGVPFPSGAALTQASALAHGGFVPGSHTNNGGAVRIEGAVGSVIAYNKAIKNFRGIRCQDCDQASIHHNVVLDNVEAGIYLAASTSTAATGSTNSWVYRNLSRGNRNNSILSIGGASNLIERNTVIGSWNAGVQLYFPAEITVRRNIIIRNNLFAFNGFGNPGDAVAGGVSAVGTGAMPATFAFKALHEQSRCSGRQCRCIFYDHDILLDRDGQGL